MSRISRMKKEPRSTRGVGKEMAPRKGNSVRNGDSGLPIRNYTNLGVAEIQKKLIRLSGADLRRIKDFEAEHKSRKTLLKTLDQKLKAA